MRLKTILASCLVMLSVTAMAKDYKYKTVAGDMTNTRIYTLDNGLRVYLSVNRQKPRIQTYIAVRTGSRNDPAETTGLAHYLEHIMFKGTTRFGTSNYQLEAPLLKQIEDKYEVYRTLTDDLQRKQCYHEIDSLSQLAARYFIPNEYDKLMSSIGAEGTNAFTSNDVTCYVENIPSNEVDNWARIQADRFQNMVVRGFHTELEAVYEEYNMGLSDDGRKVWQALFAKLYPTHPYGTQTTIGTQAHLKNPSIVNIKNYFNSYYRPNNTAICLSGDFDPDAMMAVIDKYFGQWQPNASLSFPQYAPVKTLAAPTDTTVVGQEAEALMMGWKFDGAASMQNDTLSVIELLLNNGKAGLIDLNVNQQMKSLGCYAGVIPMAEYSTFVMGGGPKEGQTLDEVKQILLEQVELLKKGEFDEGLIKSVVNNLKLQQYTALENNDRRARMYVDAFINGQKWEDQVAYLDRISKLTKQDVVSFANRHFTDGYAVVYKRTGSDASQKKIDKPQITAIPANRDMQSRFVSDILASKPEAIQPRFVDFKTDLTQGKTKKGLPVLYIKNRENGRFSLSFLYEFGEESDKWLPYASEYSEFLGTDKLTAEQLKQKFYALACSNWISVGKRTVTIGIAGLDENMPEALRLMEDFIANMKVDKDAYAKYVANIEKSRKDSKLSQDDNYSALCQYGMYGEYNTQRNIPSADELKDKDPQTLIQMLQALKGYKHTAMYYGPTDLKAFTGILDKNHKTAKKLADVPQGRKYKMQTTPQNEVIIAPYDAKNIYLRQYHNAGRVWSVDELPIIELFNEYYGNGMNAVVFQEMRETRGLAYDAWAYYGVPGYKGEPEYAITHIISQNDKMMDCVNTFNQIINQMPRSDKAFALAKQALTKRLATARTTREGIFNAYLGAKRMGIDYDINEKVYNTIPSITLDDIAKFEQERMANKTYRYLILGNEKELDMPSLEKIGKVTRVSTEQIFGY